MASDYHGQAWHDVQIYTPHCTGRKSGQVSPLCHGQEGEERGSSWLLEMREIFYYSQKHPINALNSFLIFPVYFVSSHVRDRRWLALGFAVDQAVSWCWSAQLHPSPVKWGWLTPAESLSPYHLSAGGCSVCYPFGALVSACFTLELHSVMLIEFQWQDRHKLTWEWFCQGGYWLFWSCIVLVFIVLYSRFFPAAQQSDGAGAAQPVYNCQAGPRGCNYHLPCTQTVILQDEAESLPILGQSSGLSPGWARSCIIITHESHERRAAGSSEQHSPAAELELESLFLNSAWKWMTAP